MRAAHWARLAATLGPTVMVLEKTACTRSGEPAADRLPNSTRSSRPWHARARAGSSCVVDKVDPAALNKAFDSDSSVDTFARNFLASIQLASAIMLLTAGGKDGKSLDSVATGGWAPRLRRESQERNRSHQADPAQDIQLTESPIARGYETLVLC